MLVCGASGILRVRHVAHVEKEMNRLLMVAVRDTAAENFANPIVVPNAAIAIRSFQQEVRRGGDDNQIAKFPSDFELWAIGWYHPDSGKIVQDDPEAFRRLMRGVDVKEA